MAGRGPRATSSVITPYAAPAAESDSEPDEAPIPLLQLGRGRESRGWINREEWRINIPETSDVARLRSPSHVSIFRVPKFLKQSRQEAYVPNIVSLGPYHCSNTELSPMERHKERAFHRMRTRFNSRLHNDDFSVRAKEEIWDLDDEIRKTYEEKIDCSAEALAQMLKSDGCFILEILRTIGKEGFPVEEAGNYYEPIFERNRIDYTGFDILSDILMLENQIPLIVLRKLLELELNSSSANDVETKLFKILVKYPRSKFYPFKYDMNNWSWPQPQSQPQSQPQQQQPQPQQQQQSQPQPQPQQQQPQPQSQPQQQQQQPQTQPPQVHHHLLGLLHSLILSPPCPHDSQQQQPQPQPQPQAQQQKNRTVDVVRRIPRAVELRNAGIEFKRCLGGIKKIRFDKKSATIYLPPIQITDYTEVLFRNLIAFELCKASEINYVTCYLSLMDELIDTAEDVGVLRRSEIVTNYLGSDEEVAQLIDGLCSGVTVSRRDAFQQLKGQVYKHYKSIFKVWSAELVKEYFSSPWRSLALAGAILALLLTALQTFYSVYVVYHK